MADPNLVTTCNFHGQEFLFKMNILNNNLEVLITDKNSGEEWQCSYDATYIENLTHKTGNFKQFDIFVSMIKSGLLRTSESVSLELLTFDDLEMLRSRKIIKPSSTSNSNNRRYLILTYVVEFDKIRYPLPLEYCGPPDPAILQATIRRLEMELARIKEEHAAKSNNTDSKKIYYLQKRVDELSEENDQLHEENRRLSKQGGKKPRTQMLSLQKAVHNLEKSVVSERTSHHELVEQLRTEKMQLRQELEKVKCSEKSLKLKLNRAISQNSSKIGIGDFNSKMNSTKKKSNESVRAIFKRDDSPIYSGDFSGKKNKSKGNVANKKLTNKFQTSPGLTRASRSSSSCSTSKYADTESVDVFKTIASSRITSRLASPRAGGSSKCSSGSGSRASSRGRPKSRRGAACANNANRGTQRPVEYHQLRKQLEELQRILDGNFTE